jgi:hypothetical protein
MSDMPASSLLSMTLVSMSGLLLGSSIRLSVTVSYFLADA